MRRSPSSSCTSWTIPVAGLTEMARATRRGGIVAACVWDHAGGGGPLGMFWEAARTLDPHVDDGSMLPGTREGHLAELLEQAGLRHVEQASLTVHVAHPSFDDWWQPFELGVGPAGADVAGLEPGHRARLRDGCRALFPAGEVAIAASAWGGPRPGCLVAPLEGWHANPVAVGFIRPGSCPADPGGREDEAPVERCATVH